MKPHQQAKAWRERHKLSVAELANLTGYSPEAIYTFERGSRYDGKHSEWALYRYRMACAAAEQQVKTGKVFEW
jgi:transcriptional regulator with XRE-family HTH domain